MRRTAPALLVFFGILAGLAFCEAYVRLTRPQHVFLSSQDDMDGVRCPLPSLSGRQSVPGMFDVLVSFNSQRFRGKKEYAPNPAPPTVRVAMLGDSFTFGYGANDDETYPFFLESALARRNQNVEVINAANIGTATLTQALWYDLWVRRFSPDIVILNVNSNDMLEELNTGLFVMDEKGEVAPGLLAQRLAQTRFNRGLRKSVRMIPGYIWMSQRSHLLAMIRSRFSVAAQLKDSGAAAAPKKEDIRKRLAQGDPMLRGVIRWLKARVEKSGGKLVLVFIPFHASFDGQPWSTGEDHRREHDAIRRMIGPFAARAGLPFLDLTPGLTAAYKAGEKMFYRDGHPNPQGNLVMARLVGDFLLARKIVR